MGGPPAPIPPPVKTLSLVSLFNDVASEMVYPLLPAFVTGTLGAGAAVLGVLDGASELTAAAVKWVSGRLSDRPGWRRPLILGGYATAVLVRPLMSVAGAAWQVVGFRVVDRVGKGLRTPPRDALIADLTAPAARGRAFGFHRAADHFGAVLGAVAGWALLSMGTSVRGVIGWSIVPGLVAFLLLASLLRRVPDRTAPAEPARAGARQRVFWAPVGALALIALLRAPEALLLLRLQEVGVAVPMIPLVWGGLHIVRSAASYPGGRLTDRIGGRWTVAAGGVLFAGVVATLGVPISTTLAVAVFLAFGLVAGLAEPAERSVVARLAPANIGRGFGAYHALTGIAALPAGLGFGVLYERAGSGMALATSAVGILLAVGAWVMATGSLSTDS
jgi:MFS family permease